MIKQIFILYLCAIVGLPVFAENCLILKSPANRIKANFYKDDSLLLYRISRDSEGIILPSRAGLEVDNWAWEMALGKRDLVQGASWMDLMQVDSVSYYPAVDNTWQPLYGERSTVRDRYNSATLHLSRHDKSDYRLDVEVRAYNEGIAFRYFFPEHPAAIFHKVVDDLTDYAFPAGTMAWSEKWAQAPFDYSPIDSIQRPVERALTLQLANGQWVALADADVDDWCLSKFVSDPSKANTLNSVMYSPVDIVTYYATPWKVIMIADTPGQLIENNDIISNLNPPCQISDTEWIRPGKIMRCTKLTTDAAKEVIDFCADHNMQYMLYDWKWYEPCTSHDGDATKVIDAIDMHEVVKYGKEKGIGIWLYVNQHALMKQMDELFPMLSEWGVAGVKSGFVQYASHRWAVWLHDMVRKAAANRLMMNIHDEFRPSGFSRTFPNLLTQEGICGNEEWPDATHDCTLPFTRMINGAADYTICYYDKRLKNTFGHQLAASLIYYSPLLTLFWYDNPSMSQGEPELAWFDNLPTVWDDTKVLDGYPGRNITMARRKGDIWHVGVMGNNDAQSQIVNFDFLESGKEYIAYVYEDGDESIPTATKVKCSTEKVNSKSTLVFNLKPRGGAAMRIEPAPVYGRVYPERQDDLCWENENVGFRAYGPGTQEKGEKMYGYDLFLKRGTKYPVIEHLIKTDHNPDSWRQVDSLRALGKEAKADSLINAISYHVDHGYGMDCYAVGPTLGAGVTAIVDSLGHIIYPWCYRDAEVLENGPTRFKARLTFQPFVYDGDTIIEERVITLDSGSNLNHTSVIYHGLTKPVNIVTGIVLHDQSQTIIDSGQKYMAYIDPTQGPDNGQLYMGATFPVKADSIDVQEQDGVRHLIAHNIYDPNGEGYEYYWGFGWERGNVSSLDEWIKILKNNIQQP